MTLMIGYLDLVNHRVSVIRLIIKFPSSARARQGHAEHRADVLGLEGEQPAFNYSQCGNLAE